LCSHGVLPDYRARVRCVLACFRISAPPPNIPGEQIRNGMSVYLMHQDPVEVTFEISWDG